MVVGQFFDRVSHFYTQQIQN